MSRKKPFNHLWRTKNGFRRYECEKCHCVKYWDPGFGKIIFVDRYGVLHHRTPDCVLATESV